MSARQDVVVVGFFGRSVTEIIQHFIGVKGIF